MSAFDFETTVSGKWILAGEHAVLRDHPEILFPISDRSLTLRYIDTQQALKIEFKGNTAEKPTQSFQAVLARALKYVNRSEDAITGHFIFENHIPIGAGLGASAAFCVATAKWFHWRGWLPTDELYPFAKSLEDVFHGESSGADIAVILSGKPILFQKSQGWNPFQIHWKPHWTLSYSGEPGLTAECISTVKTLWQCNPVVAADIDQQMATSVIEAQTALGLPCEAGLPLLKIAITRAANCFKQWGLITPKLAEQMQTLLEQGALAVKPTGAGRGGYVLALWSDPK